MQIEKRDGRIVDFSQNKIYEALVKCFKETREGLTQDDFKNIENLTQNIVKKLTKPVYNVEEIQDIVENELIKQNFAIDAKHYIIFRNTRSKQRNSRNALTKILKNVIADKSTTNDLKRENANIDADTSMGTMLKIGSEASKDFALKYLINPKFAAEHLNGDIHIHDLDFYPITMNCMQIPLGKLLERGFNTGHGNIRKPQSILTASALACIILQANQNEMYGGQSFPMWEYDLAPYVSKSFFNHFLECFDDYFDTDIFTEHFKKTDICDKYVKDHKTILDDSAHEYLKLLITETDEIGKTVFINSVNFDDVIFENLYQRAIKKTVKEVHQAMQAVIHNLNTMQCLPKDEQVITLNAKKVKNVDNMTNIEKEAFKELLINLYKSMTIQEIANELQSSKKVIYNLFKKYGIKLRNKKETSQFMKTRYLEKYGVTNLAQLPEIKEKIKNTQFKKYGKFAFNTSKQKETVLKRYGCENPMQNENIKEKLFQTNVKKYGNKCSLLNPDIIKKTKETNLKRYGVENVLESDSPIRQKIDYSMSDEHLAKIALTKQKRYGGIFCDSKAIKEKCEKTCLKKYGRKSFPFFMFTKHTSKKQLELFNYLKEQFPNLELHLNACGIMTEEPFYELDIWIPLLRIGIEYNGVYWHDKNKYFKDISENTVKSKERMKDVLSILNNFTLIHIWEDDYVNNEYEVKNYLNNLIITSINNLGVTND